jgi:hypothetical protein
MKSQRGNPRIDPILHNTYSISAGNEVHSPNHHTPACPISMCLHPKSLQQKHCSDAPTVYQTLEDGTTIGKCGICGMCHCTCLCANGRRPFWIRTAARVIEGEMTYIPDVSSMSYREIFIKIFIEQLLPAKRVQLPPWRSCLSSPDHDHYHSHLGFPD